MVLIMCWLSGAVGQGSAANCRQGLWLGSLLLATWLLLEAVVHAEATWFHAQREAKACLPTAVGLGRATSSELGFPINTDRGCDGGMKCRRVLVPVWCVCGKQMVLCFSLPADYGAGFEPSSVVSQECRDHIHSRTSLP